MRARSTVAQLSSHFVGRAAGLGLLAGLLLVASWQIGLLTYSPDSWAYYELSRTVFGGDFYRFTTYRSYFSDDYSAAFPLGYPVLLAVVHLVTGAQPQVAIAVNVVAALASSWVVIRLAEALSLTPLTGSALASALVLCPYYLDEVLAGRAVPVAALLLLLSLRAHLASRYLLGGVLLGFSALVRFDFLVYAIALQMALAGAGLRSPAVLLKYAGGFLLGILPWVLYSKIRFDSFWVSDNAWVASSAVRAFVLDYPAQARLSAVEDPQAWIQKVVGHVNPLLNALSEVAQKVPLLSALAVSLLLPGSRMARHAWIPLACCTLALMVAVMPYLLTGYFDGRYFSLVMLVAAGVLAWFVERSLSEPARDPAYRAALVLSILFSSLLAALHLDTLASAQRAASDSATQALIERLRICQASQPGVIYIFADQYGNLAPRYGALTGQRAAYRPSNFKRMNEQEKSGYFARMRPYALIDKHLESHACPSVH